MLEKDKLVEALNCLVLANNNKTEAARLYGTRNEVSVARTTFKDWLNRAEELGIEPSILPPNAEAKLTEQKLKSKTEITSLKRQVEALSQSKLTASSIRKHIFKLAEASPNPPNWLIDPASSKSSPGVPTLLLSDFHWGEVVDPEQVNHVNEYNLETAKQRLHTTVEKTIDICFNHTVNPDYPGIVLALGGDMVSGDIHEEIAKTNDGYTMEHVFDMFDHFVAVIDTLADKFGRVFVPTAYGNHGRNTRKPITKGAAQTNFDWMLYTMLEKHYASDIRVRFMVPTGYDAFYSIYGTNYLLTHGDRIGARGGDGIIGIIGPIIRGTKKIKAHYDTMEKHIDCVIMGHYHTYLNHQGIIVNGSLKGYDEYAMANRFNAEPPQQALWFTHPDHGITLTMSIRADQKPKAPEKSWVSWQE